MVYQLVQEHPGLSYQDLGRLLGTKFPYGTLAALERAGFLLYEDDRNRLYAFTPTTGIEDGYHAGN
jgi:hypothetical protein